MDADSLLSFREAKQRSQPNYFGSDSTHHRGSSAREDVFLLPWTYCAPPPPPSSSPNLDLKVRGPSKRNNFGHFPPPPQFVLFQDELNSWVVLKKGPSTSYKSCFGCLAKSARLSVANGKHQQSTDAFTWKDTMTAILHFHQWMWAKQGCLCAVRHVVSEIISMGEGWKHTLNI